MSGYLHMYTHLAWYKFKTCLLVDFFQCMHKYLVIHICKMHSREDILDQSIKTGAISKGQFGHGVQSQGLYHQTALLICT